MIIISIVDNQINQSKAWSERGCALYIGQKHEISKFHLVSAFQKVSLRQVYKHMMDALLCTMPEHSSIDYVTEIFR